VKRKGISLTCRTGLAAAQGAGKSGLCGVAAGLPVWLGRGMEGEREMEAHAAC
jgi:hypothetical protein